MDLSVGKLQQLVTVARLGSFSAAAQVLNISQPALSRSIAGLEHRYGFQIFSRVGHGVQLTAAGTQVIELARPLLQDMQVFDNNLKLFGSGKVGSLAIGMAPLLASEVLAELASEFFNSASRVDLQVTTQAGSILMEKLKRDEIELVFYPAGYMGDAPELEVETLGYIEPVCVVRRGHPLLAQVLAQGELTRQDLADFPWASSVLPEQLREAIQPSQFVCDNYHILRETVLNSDLICICTRNFVRQQLADGLLCEIAVTGLPLPPTAICAARLPGRISSPLALEAVGSIRARLQRQL